MNNIEYFNGKNGRKVGKVFYDRFYMNKKVRVKIFKGRFTKIPYDLQKWQWWGNPFIYIRDRY